MEGPVDSNNQIEVKCPQGARLFLKDGQKSRKTQRCLNDQAFGERYPGENT